MFHCLKILSTVTFGRTILSIPQHNALQRPTPALRRLSHNLPGRVSLAPFAGDSSGSSDSLRGLDCRCVDQASLLQLCGFPPAVPLHAITVLHHLGCWVILEWWVVGHIGIVGGGSYWNSGWWVLLEQWAVVWMTGEGFVVGGCDGQLADCD